MKKYFPLILGCILIVGGAVCGLYFLVHPFLAPVPLAFTLGSFGDFFAHFFDNFLFYPLGLLLHFLCRAAGGNYLVAVASYTLLMFLPLHFMSVRQENFSFKVRLVQPELDKIDAKYAAFDDEQSRQRVSMEKMWVYKKYGIRPGGCLVTPLVTLLVPLSAFVVFARFPHTAAWASGVQSEFFGFDLFRPMTGGLMQIVGCLSLWLLYLLLFLFQRHILDDDNTKRKQNPARKKKYRKIIQTVTAVATPVFGVVSFLNDNGTYIFLPQELMRPIGYVGFGGALLFLALSFLMFLIDYCEAHRDEVAYRSEQSQATPEQRENNKAAIRVMSVALPAAMLIVLFFVPGAAVIYLPVMTLASTATTMCTEIRRARARKDLRARSYVTITDFRLIHSALIEEYQHIDRYLAEIKGEADSLAELDQERLASVLERESFWRSECYLNMTLDPERGGPTDQQMARSAYTDRTAAKELREQLARIRAALLEEEKAVAKEAEAAPEPTPTPDPA